MSLHILRDAARSQVYAGYVHLPAWPLLPSERKCAHPRMRGITGRAADLHLDHAQLFAPVTCAKASSLMLVPMSFSSLVTYCATCSSVMARSSVSFSFFMSSEERSTGGTVTSETRNTIHSLPPEPGVCPTPSFALRNAAVIAP